MQPLIDGDILRYEVGFMAEPKGEDGEKMILDFDRVAHLLDDRIRVICAEVGATEPPILFITSDKKMDKKLEGGFKPNFREAIAITKPYKGTRKSEKPHHFRNITAYMLAEYDCRISNGIEADDDMCIEQYMRWNCNVGPEPSIICSRDKDLRMCPGWHYSWECGKQASIGPVFVEGTGWLEKKPDGKIIGYGDKLFYYQMLVGDTVDNIPGAPGVGPAKAFKLLDPIDNISELYTAVKRVYMDKSSGGDEWKVYMKEQANLLWMVREFRDGVPVMYTPKEYVE